MLFMSSDGAGVSMSNMAPYPLFKPCPGTIFSRKFRRYLECIPEEEDEAYNLKRTHISDIPILATSLKKRWTTTQRRHFQTVFPRLCIREALIRSERSFGMEKSFLPCSEVSSKDLLSWAHWMLECRLRQSRSEQNGREGKEGGREGHLKKSYMRNKFTFTFTPLKSTPKI